MRSVKNDQGIDSQAFKISFKKTDFIARPGCKTQIKVHKTPINDLCCNQDGNNALHVACINTNANCVAELLEWSELSSNDVHSLNRVCCKMGPARFLFEVHSCFRTEKRR